MNKDLIIRKIKKCFALSKSDNANEAATALRQAHKLMEQNEITNFDLESSEIKESEVKTDLSAPLDWALFLSNAVSDFFSCQILIKNNFQPKKHISFLFFGVGSNAEIAAYSFEVIFKQCVKARADFIKGLLGSRKTKTMIGDNFATGFVIEVQDKIKDVLPNKQTQDKIMKVIEQRTKTIAKTKSRTSTNVGGYHEGAEAAKDVRLHHAVTGSENNTLEIGN